MTEGTGTTYKLSGIECFGKTGTTNDNKDRWFIGGTPDFVCSDQQTTVLLDAGFSLRTEATTVTHFSIW